MRLIRFACVAVAVLIGSAQAESPLDGLVRQNLQPMIDAHTLAGAAVAVVRGDTTEFFYLGFAQLDKAIPVTGETLFEIGSITKTFTGTLLSLMIQDCTVALDTPVQSLLPAGVSMPKSEARTITLQDLCTHTSGLPRMPSNFSPKDAQQPYVDYTATTLYEFLNTYTLPRAPGATMEYSNVATALLGHVLALKDGAPYETLMRTRIWKPLGMNNTYIGLSESQLSRLAQGYTTSNQIFRHVLHETSHWDFDVFAAAGGIRSTIADMAIYLRANMQPDATPLSKAMTCAHAALYPLEAPRAVGMNWMLNARPTGEAGDVWHNGQTGGYHAFLCFDPIGKEGIVILANTATDIDLAGWKILEELKGSQRTEAATAP